MNDTRSLTIQLSPEERSILFAEAQRRNLSPHVLALEIVRDSIAQMQQFKDQVALNALDRLDELVSHLPLVDAVKLVRASREELEQRGNLSQ